MTYALVPGTGDDKHQNYQPDELSTCFQEQIDVTGSFICSFESFLNYGSIFLPDNGVR